MRHFITRTTIPYILGSALLFSPASQLAAYATPSCLKYVASTFYDDNSFQQAMNLHNVAQSSWDLIRTELKSRTEKVFDEMYLEGKQQESNPFDYPFQPEEAEKLFLKALFKQFNETLRKYNATSTVDIRGMFEYIKAYQKARLHACLYPNAKR